MLFTSLQITANAKSSFTFKENGNPEGMPTAVSDLSIFAVKDQFNPTHEDLINNLQHHIAASEQQSVLYFKAGYDFLRGKGDPITFSPPPIGLKFDTPNNATLSESLSNLGFTKDSHGILARLVFDQAFWDAADQSKVLHAIRNIVSAKNPRLTLQSYTPPTRCLRLVP